MGSIAKQIDTTVEATGGNGASQAVGRRGRSRLARLSSLLWLGVAGLVFGGLPYLAAKRLLNPLGAEALPHNLALDMGIDIFPEKVEFESGNGHLLSGWFVPGPDSKAAPWPTILLVYGYGGYKEQMSSYAHILRAGGFATLMFDMQGSGLRRGHPVSLGYRERLDVLGASRYLRTRGDVDAERIGILGVSMGAATALLAAADDPSIKAIVSDSAYASMTDMVKPGVKAFLGAPALPFAPLILRYAEAIIGAKTSEVVPERAAARLGDRPLFVVHGADDGLIALDSAHRIYAAASGPKELWIVDECTHAEAPNVQAEEYMNRVNDFFRRWLGGF